MTVWNFSYVGEEQFFIVPAGITSLDFVCVGAGGGSYYAGGGGIGPTNPGAGGGTLEAIISVTPGETLGIYVGGVGQSAPRDFPSGGTPVGGWNGGGNGGGVDINSGRGGAGGGGATDVRQNGTTLANRVVTAGGGGGASDNGSAPASGGGPGGGGGSHFGIGDSSSISSGGGGGGYWGGLAGTLFAGGQGGSSNTSGISVVDNAGSPTGGGSNGSIVITTSVPGAPTIGTAIGSDSEITVTWTPPVNTGSGPILNYIITPYIGSTPQSTILVGNVTSYNWTGLTNGVGYTFRVAAINVVGTGPQSASSNLVASIDSIVMMV